MLPREHRLRRSQDFSLVFRKGKRFGAKRLVVHLYIDTETHAERVGFVVSKAVGNAVARNLVKRRLRAIVARHRDQLPGGAMLVIRALPGAADAAFGDLEVEVLGGLKRFGRIQSESGSSANAEDRQ
ncbi:ribonuclease P protein component [Saxibacter everestensis]|uniref:Ribonuclease P protein component n=1 Tax=Saxibacter everestensis TaxID=2909229 RepID=A0ABY8QU00_9MICO|nr:ribonuclease P protein component [Brevibacteriaceae bacterium ZFBP1038]